jgi:DNA-binding protein, histone-like, putative
MQGMPDVCPRRKPVWKQYRNTMPFFKKVKKKINGLWYAQSVTVGKPVTTDQVADRLAQISTLGRGDTYAVLKNLGDVLSEYMRRGRTVKLDGIGTFYYTAATNGNGVATEEEVTAELINGVRVRFIPETTRTANNKVATRAMVGNNLFWQEWGKTTKANTKKDNKDVKENK